MMRHYPDLCGASDWLKQIFWVVTCHQYGRIVALVPQTSFHRETSEYWLFLWAKLEYLKLFLVKANQVYFEFPSFADLPDLES